MISIFTNIPVNLAIENISNIWVHISKGTKIPKNEFINALKLILESTFFRFNNSNLQTKIRHPHGFTFVTHYFGDSVTESGDESS